MDKLISAVLPKDVFTEILSFVFRSYDRDRYDYIISTFAKNVSYMENDRSLTFNAKEIDDLREIELRIEELSADYAKCQTYIIMAKIDVQRYYIENLCNPLNMMVKTNNIGALKYLHETHKLRDNVGTGVGSIISHKVLEGVVDNNNFEMLKYLITKTSHMTYKNSIGTRIYFCSRIHDVLLHVCRKNRFDMVKFIVQWLPPQTDKNNVRDSIDITDIFVKTCSVYTDKYKEMLKYLRQAFKLKLKSQDIYDTVLCVVRLDNPDLLEFLVETLNLTNKEAMAKLNIDGIYKQITHYGFATNLSRYIKDTFYF